LKPRGRALDIAEPTTARARFIGRQGPAPKCTWRRFRRHVASRDGLVERNPSKTSTSPEEASLTLLLKHVGVEYGAVVETIDPDHARAYAAATNESNSAYLEGDFAPPVFGVVPTWSVMRTLGKEILPVKVGKMVVHGEQDMHFHQPLVHNLTLSSTGSLFSVRVGEGGTRLVLYLKSLDEAGALVMEQYSTMFVRGWTEADPVGPDKPEHTFPEGARNSFVGEHSVRVDDDQTFRYRDASGDDMPIHVDNEFAKRVGLPGIIIHGLCTMAMTSQSVLTVAGEDSPARLRRLAVRFAANVFPGNEVTTRVYDAGQMNGRRRLVFEAASGGKTVITNGLAELAFG
jgi:acyl dehydratase